MLEIKFKVSEAVIVQVAVLVDLDSVVGCQDVQLVRVVVVSLLGEDVDFLDVCLVLEVVLPVVFARVDLFDDELDLQLDEFLDPRMQRLLVKLVNHFQLLNESLQPVQDVFF